MRYFISLSKVGFKDHFIEVSKVMYYSYRRRKVHTETVCTSCFTGRVTSRWLKLY